jgi:N-acetylglucosamine kinase-like BadF-type ATPase
MIVIADSGASKTDWRIILPTEGISSFSTIGLNPYFTSEDKFYSELKNSFPKELSPLQVRQVFFYGAGCSSAEMANVAAIGLASFFPSAQIDVQSDVLAAARSVFGVTKGIVVILGTGTNVGFFDGQRVLNYSPSLGYVLGDEGSGAFLGKQLLKMYLYDELPTDLVRSFKTKYDGSLSTILRSVYTNPFPGKYLADFVPFIYEYKGHEAIDGIVTGAFEEMFEKHIQRIPNFFNFPIGVVGSVGTLFIEKLTRIVTERGGTIKKAIQYPIEELVRFHQEK